MKRLTPLLLALFLLLLLGRLAAHAQSVGIGTATPDASAALDIRAIDKGLLVPRLTAGQRTGITAPPQGLMVYQTDGTASGGPQTGFWYHAGTPAAWTFLDPTGADNLGNHAATQNLNLAGNALTGTGASVGAAVGLGVRADGGLNLGQNSFANNLYLGFQAGQANVLGSQNQFVGYQSGQANTSGSDNLFSGYQAGYANTTGNFNLFSGYQSGYANTTGGGNLFSGPYSGQANTTGSFNLFVGYQSGQANTTGSRNHFNGYQTGFSNTTGNDNDFGGYQSGYANTTGNFNHFGGYQSGYANTSGVFNQFVGYQSGQANTTGSLNHFSGYQSGYANTTGQGNTFTGYSSGLRNTTGNYNTFAGSLSGGFNRTGGGNTFTGAETGVQNAGSYNTFAGFSSGTDNTTGSNNTFAGAFSGNANTTGSDNQFSGLQSGYFNTTGSSNYFSGYQSGYSNSTASNNQFVGYQSGRANTTGSLNQFNGYRSGYVNTSGSRNQFSGLQSGFFNTTGFNNHFSGYLSGYYNTTGSSNTALGYNAGPAFGSGALTNATALGNNAAVSQSNALVLGGAGADAVRVGVGTPAPAERLHVVGAGTTLLRLQSSGSFGAAGVEFWSDPQGSANEWRPASLRSTDAGGFTGGLAFFTNGTGAANRTATVEQMRIMDGGVAIGTTALGSHRLNVAGTVGATFFAVTSDQRLKQHIRPLTGALAGVLALRGVRYEWNAEGVRRGGAANTGQVGLLAQEVEKLYPELVHTGPDGFKAVNYAQLAPVLIEALKELQAKNEAANARADRAEVTTAAFEQRLRALEAGAGQAQASPR